MNKIYWRVSVINTKFGIKISSLKFSAGCYFIWKRLTHESFPKDLGVFFIWIFLSEHLMSAAFQMKYSESSFRLISFKIIRQVNHYGKLTFWIFRCESIQVGRLYFTSSPPRPGFFPLLCAKILLKNSVIFNLPLSLLLRVFLFFHFLLSFEWSKSRISYYFSKFGEMMCKA